MIPVKQECLIKGVEHIAIATTNPQQLSVWYIKHLGFVPLLDTGTTVYVRSSNSVILEFVKADAVPSKPQIRDAGLRHVAFAVDDLEVVHGRLKSDGVEFEPAPILLPGMRLFFFRDPEGNWLHLVQRAAPLL